MAESVVTELSQYYDLADYGDAPRFEFTIFTRLSGFPKISLLVRLCGAGIEKRLQLLGHSLALGSDRPHLPPSERRELESAPRTLRA